MFTRVWPGSPYPLGATWDGSGVNFALFSENATQVELCLFDSAEARAESARIAMPSVTNQVWHCYLPDAKPGQLYGYRVHGPDAPNAYCQDSLLSWINWDLSKDQRELLGFVRRLVRLRRENPVFRRRGFFQGRPIRGLDLKDLYWLTPSGTEMADSDWNAGHVQCLGMGLMGDQIEETDEHGWRIIGDSFVILLNADNQAVSFRLGGRARSHDWELLVDTSRPRSRAGVWSVWTNTRCKAARSPCCVKLHKAQSETRTAIPPSGFGIESKQMNISSLGQAQFASPVRHSVSDQARIPADIVRDPAAPERDEVLFELAGPRAKLFFEPARTRAGIVTCGGLCPGLNNVIRALFFELHHTYGAMEVLGFRGGYQGLDPALGSEPVVLTPAFVDQIHHHGGTILGTSRGPVDMAAAVDDLIRRDVRILFTVGGDGTQRGGNELFQQAQRRGHALSVVGIPKTIDNDVPFVARTFGYLTAVEEAVKILDCAHTEARSVHNGVALVKLMGRHAGFIAAGATVANHDVNFTLIPEVPFKLEGKNGFLSALKNRIQNRRHAVVVVAEGAGQELFADSAAGKTGLVIGYLHDLFIHIPIDMLVREKKQIDPSSVWWTAVLAATGQPARFE